MHLVLYLVLCTVVSAFKAVSLLILTKIILTSQALLEDPWNVIVPPTE